MREQREGEATVSGPVMDLQQRPGPLRKAARVWAGVQAASLFAGLFFMQVFGSLGFILALFARSRRWIRNPFYHRAVWALAASVIVFLLSAIMSDSPLDSLRHLVQSYTMPLVTFSAALLLLRSRRIRQVAINTLLFGGAISGLYGLFQHVFGIDFIYGQEIKRLVAYGMDLYLPVGLLDMALTYAGVQMTALLAVLPTVWYKRGKKAWIWWLAAVLIAASIFFTYRRGPILATAAVIGVWLLLRNRRVAIITVLSGLLLVAAAWFGSSAFRQGMKQVVEVKGVSVSQRVLLWDIAWEMGEDYPLLGVGPGLWRRHVSDYYDNDVAVPGKSFAHPHSDPLNLWATTGFAGLASIAALNLLLFGYGVIELRSRRDRRGKPDYQLYSGGLLALAGMVLASFAQCYMLDAENMFAHGFVLALMLNAREGLLRKEAADQGEFF